MRVLAAIALTGCGFSVSVTPSNAGGDAPSIDAAIDATPIDGPPGAARKRRITIPDAKVFASLTDFPVWLVIDDLPGLGMKATASGADIYFTRTDGTPLEHERVAWNPATGHLEAWVKVDLTDGTTSEFELRFGDPGPAHAPNAPLVWTNGFVAVWHMDDALAGNTTVADARGAVMGTAVNGPTSAAGKLGKALDFDGSNDEVTFANPITGGGSTTISAWVAVAQPAMAYSSVMTVGSATTNQSRFLHTNYPGLGIGFYGNDVQTNTNIHNNQFTLLHWVYDGGAKQSSLYRDAQQVGTTASISGTINTQGLGGHLGAAPTAWGPGGNNINGLLDEVRISNQPRSLGWIRTEYENQRDVAGFFLLGPDVAAQ